jgi:transaldolase
MAQTTFSFNRSIFIDSSNLEEIKKWNATGVIDGVTTNQMIMLKDGVKPSEYETVIKNICSEMKDKPVSVELTDSTATPEEMLTEAKRLNALADNIVVKVPLIPDTTKSLYVVKQLAEADIAVNITTMMTYEQMIMAILASRYCRRLSFVSIFWGRSTEDHETYRSKPEYATEHPKFGVESEIDADVARQVAECARFLQEGGYTNPKIIVGSIRTASQVGLAYAAGGHIPTVPPAVLEAMLYSKRSIETIEAFDTAWKDLQAQKN